MLALLIWVLGWAGTGFLSDQGELAILKGDFFFPYRGSAACGWSRAHPSGSHLPSEGLAKYVTGRVWSSSCTRLWWGFGVASCLSKAFRVAADGCDFSAPAVSQLKAAGGDWQYS